MGLIKVFLFFFLLYTSLDLSLTLNQVLTWSSYDGCSSRLTVLNTISIIWGLNFFKIFQNTLFFNRESQTWVYSSHRFVFQHDNNPKHTSLVSNHLQKTKVNITEWSAQNPDLNQIEKYVGVTLRKVCVVTLRTMSAPEDHQIWRELRDWPEKMRQDSLKEVPDTS